MLLIFLDPLDNPAFLRERELHRKMFEYTPCPVREPKTHEEQERQREQHESYMKLKAQEEAEFKARQEKYRQEFESIWFVKWFRKVQHYFNEPV